LKNPSSGDELVDDHMFNGENTNEICEATGDLPAGTRNMGIGTAFGADPPREATPGLVSVSVAHPRQANIRLLLRASQRSPRGQHPHRRLDQLPPRVRRCQGVRGAVFICQDICTGWDSDDADTDKIRIGSRSAGTRIFYIATDRICCTTGIAYINIVCSCLAC
jgi:hypothetical protein